MANETSDANGRTSAKVTSIDSAKPRNKKTARRATKKKDPAIQETLDSLTSAMTSGDGQTCASLWLTPAFFVGDDMLKAVEDPADIAEWFGGAKQMYADKGITDTRAEIESIEWLTDKLVLVACRFPYLDDEGAEHGDERSTYTMRKEEDGSYKFCVAIMRGVSELKQNDMEEQKTAEDAN